MEIVITSTIFTHVAILMVEIANLMDIVMKLKSHKTQVHKTDLDSLNKLLNEPDKDGHYAKARTMNELRAIAGAPIASGNATIPRRADVIIYNRVPKSASTLISQLIYRLHDKNVHDFAVDNQIELGQSHYFKSDFGLTNWVKRLYTLPDPTVIIRHQYFVNLNAINKERIGPLASKFVDDKRIIWINFVRDPIEQYISNWYYMRHGFQGKKDNNKNRLWRETNLNEVDPKTWNITLDECIKKKVSEECLFPQSEFISYFCGNTESCRPKFLHAKFANDSYSKSNHERNSDLAYALNRAKSNIKSHYFIVGHLERLEEFIQFLHNSLPRYFRGSKFFYDRMTQNSSFYFQHYDSTTAGRVTPNKSTYWTGLGCKEHTFSEDFLGFLLFKRIFF